jgi:putative endonuclease
MASKTGVLYTGVTNDLFRRSYEHKNEMNEGFSKKYGVKKLVYFETFSDVSMAIQREKQIKGWSRAKKIELIENKNHDWLDLSEAWFKRNNSSSSPNELL